VALEDRNSPLMSRATPDKTERQSSQVLVLRVQIQSLNCYDTWNKKSITFMPCKYFVAIF